MIQEITKAAAALGACNKSAQATDWRSLAWLLFSPQGREFCEEHSFPTVSMWSGIKQQCDTSKFGIYIDAGFIHVHDRENVAVVGKTNATLHFNKPDKAHRVMVMHGASATVIARNYAVVNITKVGQDTDVIIDKDESSVILW